VEKQLSITYSQCVSVALVMQHAIRMRRIVICGLPRSTTLFQIYSNGTILEKKNKIKALKINCVLTLSTVLSEIFFILRRTERDVIKLYVGLHVQYRYCCQILMNLGHRRSSEKCSNIRLNESPSNGSRAVPCGPTDMT